MPMGVYIRKITPPQIRILNRVIIDPISSCWIFLGCKTRDGYGQFKLDPKSNGRTYLTHVFMYEHYRGLFSEELQLDHLCRVRICCNPWHLEAVTQSINQLRGNAGLTSTLRNRKITHCPQNHKYTKENTYLQPKHNKPGKFGRVCRICKKEYMDEYLRKKRF